MYPQNSSVAVLTPRISEWDLIWEQGHHNVISDLEVILGWGGAWLIQSDWCPYKKGTSGHRDTYTEEDDMKTHSGETATWKPRNARGYQKLGERPGTDFPLRALRGSVGLTP